MQELSVSEEPRSTLILQTEWTSYGYVPSTKGVCTMAANFSEMLLSVHQHQLHLT